MTRELDDTDQAREWAGAFGKDYTERNPSDIAELDAVYRRTFGTSRTLLNESFLAEVPKDSLVLEVGCNVGNQLGLLANMGYRNLHGVEIQSHALETARERLPNVEFCQASALSLPYPARHFDLVFTSGLLIHIAPRDLPQAMSEIHRCTKRWIWGLEYYAPQPQEVLYHGRHLANQNVDTMFLLRRKHGE